MPDSNQEAEKKSVADPQSDSDWWRYFPELNPNPVFELRLDNQEVTYANGPAKNLQNALGHDGWRSAKDQFIALFKDAKDEEAIQQDELEILGRYYDAKLKYFSKYNTVRVFLTDHTLLKEAHKELQKAKQLAESQADIKSTFLANMSHEIRTPINGVVGATELLLDSSLSSEQLELLKIIHSSAKSLGNIINDVLDLSKIDNDMIVLESIPLDLKTLVNDLVSVMKLEAKRKNLSLSAHFSCDELPSCVGDPTRIRQVLSNIVGNAIKFTTEGAVKINVDYRRLESEQLLLTFEISDTGIGIDSDQVERIFDAFIQAESSTTRQYGGSGLGMAISRDLAQLMSGDISVLSTKGEGATFTFTALVLEQAQALSKDSSVGIAQSRRYGKKVLLAEDVAVNALLAEKMLASLGIDVDVVENGTRAVAAFNDSYDLVLMDMQMPELDGVDAAKQIISKGCTVPIIAFTANASKDDIQRCSDAGMSGHLAKPLYKEHIIQELDKHLIR